MAMPPQHVDVPHEILTDRLLLRSYKPSDAEGLIEAIDTSRTELEAWMDWVPHMRQTEDAMKFVANASKARDAGTDFAFGMFLRDEGRFLGGTGFHRPKWRVPSLEIGYWMRTSEVGKGYVREAVIALTQVGFGQLGLRRMEIRCDAENARSRRVAESVGYVLEGRLRNEDRTPAGEMRDTLVFSLIDSDDIARDLVSTAPSQRSSR